MNEIIIVKTDKCVGCNACVRACPAPEANITKLVDGGRFVTSVNPEKCIACGECTRVCEHNARDYVDDTREFMSVQSKEKLAILVAPSIKTVFPTKWKSILNYFRSKGHLIFDVSFGADICTWAHLVAEERGMISNIITQPCAAIVKYIETYQPLLIRNLSPIHSPMACEAIYLRKYLRYQNRIAFLSPCVAKKNEFRETGIAEFNVTYKKLMEFFDISGINIPLNDSNDLTYPFDDGQGLLGGIYPKPGGLRDNLLMHDPDIDVINSEGVEKVYDEIDQYATMNEEDHPLIFDVLSCKFGCNTGPGTGSKQSMFSVMSMMKKVEKHAKERRQVTSRFRGAKDKLFERFNAELDVADFVRTYRPVIPSPAPDEKEINRIFEQMGKITDADKHRNCHACGYKSCTDMAIAISRGLNVVDNCHMYAQSVLLSKHKSLEDDHKKLDAIAKACVELSRELDSNFRNVDAGIKEIDDSAEATLDRATKVNDLLSNVILFCENNTTMDKNTVTQLIDILRVTLSAFNDLDKSIEQTKNGSEIVTKSISGLQDIITNMSNELSKQ